MEECTTQIIKKELKFENNRETLSVQIVMENVSPNIDKNSIIAFLDTLYEKVKKELKCQ